MLNVLEPSFVLDLTATPRESSNIISFVTAQELKNENMVKLPVIIQNNQKLEGVISNALHLRRILEKKGYIEQLYCNSNSHSYYVLTDKGKEYGYNIGSASYSIIHWRVERFEELFRIVTNSAAK